MVEFNYFALLARRQQIRIKLTLRREDFASRGPNAISSYQVEDRGRRGWIGSAVSARFAGLAGRMQKTPMETPFNTRPPRSVPGARKR